MAINIAGLVGMIVFYLIILVIGLLASWFKTRKATAKVSAEESLMTAGRDIGLVVGVFTMTATWVGGGYISGTAQSLFGPGGLVNCQAPFGYALSLVVGGLFFANKMRAARYVTMLDPFQQKYGSTIGGLLFIPALCGEIMWSGAILRSLGTTVGVILGLNTTISVIASACVAVFYTFLGGLFAVAYTDVAQLICIIIGLVIPIPFAWHNKHVNFNQTDVDWVGTVAPEDVAIYIDTFLLLIFGGLPWQVYFQRVLSVRTAGKAQMLSFLGAVGCVVLSVPPILIGIIGKYTDFVAAGALGDHFPGNHSDMVLPAVIQYMTPTGASFVGLGAISAAVMSSADSSMLSASSMFAHNIYKNIFRHHATDKEILWVVRISIVVCGVLACLLGLSVTSIYDLWYLSSDLVYVILFPNLVCVIYVGFVNSYGVITGYCVSLLLRILGGEASFNLSPVIRYVGFNYEKDTQRFPHRTFAMLVNLSLTLLVSYGTQQLYKRTRNANWDVLKVFKGVDKTSITGGSQGGGAGEKYDMHEKRNSDLNYFDKTGVVGENPYRRPSIPTEEQTYRINDGGAIVRPVEGSITYGRNPTFSNPEEDNKVKIKMGYDNGNDNNTGIRHHEDGTTFTIG